MIYLLTYLLTPWSRVLLEKLTGFAANPFQLILIPLAQILIDHLTEHNLYSWNLNSLRKNEFGSGDHPAYSVTSPPSFITKLTVTQGHASTHAKQSWLVNFPDADDKLQLTLLLAKNLRVNATLGRSNVLPCCR
jgi:hypothetical protein